MSGSRLLLVETRKVTQCWLLLRQPEFCMPAAGGCATKHGPVGHYACATHEEKIDMEISPHSDEYPEAVIPSHGSAPDNAFGEQSCKGVEQAMYRVLLAVERGELSTREAARQLDELEVPDLTGESEAAELQAQQAQDTTTDG